MNEPTQIPASEARQGRRGRHMVMVLFASLALAGLVWIGLAVFGESINSNSVDQSGVSADQPNP